MLAGVRTRWILLGGSLIVAACSVYDESLLEPGGSGGGGPSVRCEHATYPEPPDETGLGGDIEFTVAMSSLSFGDPHAVSLGLKHHTEIGFDLDLTCTGQGEGNSCVVPEWATATEKTDGDGGRDNAVGALIARVQEMIPEFGSASYTSIVHEGQTSVLFNVRGYNGLPNDDQIEASLFVAAPFDSNDPGAKPKWDGSDIWPIASDSLEDGETLAKPRYHDPHAYVKDGILVASLPEASLRLPNGLLEGNAGSMNMKLVGAFLAGKLVEVDAADGQRWELQDVHLGGRWPADDLVKQLSQFPEPPTFQNPLCMDSPAYAMFRNLLCSYTDIYAGIASPTSVCNAISFGLHLETKPAYLGEVVQVEPPATDRCPSETDPVQDACGKPIPAFD